MTMIGAPVHATITIASEITAMDQIPGRITMVVGETITTTIGANPATVGAMMKVITEAAEVVLYSNRQIVEVLLNSGCEVFESISLRMSEMFVLANVPQIHAVLIRNKTGPNFTMILHEHYFVTAAETSILILQQNETAMTVNKTNGNVRAGAATLPRVSSAVNVKRVSQATMEMLKRSVPATGVARVAFKILHHVVNANLAMLPSQKVLVMTRTAASRRCNDTPEWKITSTICINPMKEVVPTSRHSKICR